MALPPLSKKTVNVPNKFQGASSSDSTPTNGKIRLYPDVSANASNNCTLYEPGSQSGFPQGTRRRSGDNTNGSTRPSRGSASIPQSRPGLNVGGGGTSKNDSTAHLIVGAKRTPKRGGNSNMPPSKQRQNQSSNGRSGGKRNSSSNAGERSSSSKATRNSDSVYGPKSRYDSLPRQNTDSAAVMVSNNMQGYTATLANPKENMFRIPDSSIDATALVRSIRTFEIDTYFTGSPDDGKFSIAVQPKPGNIDDPTHYQSLIIDSTNGWPVGKFGEVNSYLQFTDKSGDPRLDSNWNTLFAQPTGLYSVSGLTQNQKLFAGAPNVMGTSYGLKVLYDTGSGAFTLPPGTYLFVCQFDSQTITSLSVNTSATTALYEEVLNGNNSATFIVSAVSPGKDSFVPYYDPNGGPYGTFLTYVNISPVTSEGTFSSANYGNVTMLRPVGMSLLCTFTGTEFSDGGRIATGLMRPGALTTQFLTNNPVQGNQLQEVETLGTIPGTYNGQFKQGVYSYWLPLDKVKDVAFYTPDEANEMEYPFLVASGQLSTTGTVTSTVVASIRVEISIVYEFQTQASMWELQRCYGDDARLSMATMIFMNQPNAMQNEQHAKWLRWLLDKAQTAIGWYNRYKDPIEALYKATLLVAAV